MERQSRSTLSLLIAQLTHLLAEIIYAAAIRQSFPIFFLHILPSFLIILLYCLSLLTNQITKHASLNIDAYLAPPSVQALRQSTMSAMRPNQQDVQETEALVPDSKFLELNISGTVRQVLHYGSNSSDLAMEHEIENEIPEPQATPGKASRHNLGHADGLVTYRYKTQEEGRDSSLYREMWMLTDIEGHLGQAFHRWGT